MTELMQIDSYGALVGPDTLRIQRLLPGPIERVWSYLVDSELRKLWFADGEIEPVEGAPFELVWRNDERAGAQGQRPKDVSEEHRMQSEVIVAEAPRKLVIAWANTGNVTFELEPHGEGVLLTITHAGFQTRSRRWLLSGGRRPSGLTSRLFAPSMEIACQSISEPEPCARCAFLRWA